MNPQGGEILRWKGADDPVHLHRKGPSVGVTEHDPVRSRLGPGFQHLESVGGIVFPAVEKVLQVEDHFSALGLQKAQRIEDHFQILLMGGPEHLLHMGLPGFSHNDDGGCPRFQKRPDVGVFPGLPARLAGGPEGGDFRVPELFLLCLGEEGRLLFVGQGEAPFDEIDAHFIQLVGDLDFIAETETHLDPLHAVPQGGVEQADFSFCHILLPSGPRRLPGARIKKSGRPPPREGRPRFSKTTGLGFPPEFRVDANSNDDAVVAAPALFHDSLFLIQCKSFVNRKIRL